MKKIVDYYNTVQDAVNTWVENIARQMEIPVWGFYVIAMLILIIIFLLIGELRYRLYIRKALRRPKNGIRG